MTGHGSVHLSEKQFMQTQVAGELGMEGGGQDVSLAAQDWVVVDAGQDLDVVADALDVGSANEHGRDASHAVDFEVGLEGVDLASERIAAHFDVEDREAALVWPTVEDDLRQEDHPRTRPEGGHPV